MIRLYDHNQTAYESAVNLLSRTGKAAIIHPTGTGKSFIAFKLAEDHPGSSFLWLSPSERIYQTQLEAVKKASDYSPDNITFFTYAKLTNLTDEERALLRPDYIILDEFHRAGAPEWGKGVRHLIDNCPKTKLLGLSATSIRYLDNRRDMASELFDNSIASQMSLTEAITRGILPAPKYVVSIYAYKLEEEKYRKRLYHVSPPVRRQAEEYLKKLRCAIDKAEGPEKIFPKHMQDPHGKYIVFCSDYAHMQEMMRKSHTWFKTVDENPHFYSVWSDSESIEKDYSAFRKDDSDHLRLLFCIDMFNEGIHVEDLSGVILFRPTGSPIIYKQQIGRALSAIQAEHCQPIIFDIVNNFENLCSISSVQEEIQRITDVHKKAVTDNADILSFQIIDEVRECRELFRRLEDSLSHSWEMMYQAAKQYYEQNGHLQVPKAYKTSEGYSLGAWIITQRRVRKGEIYGILTEDRIYLLDQIGMIWKNRNETAWENGLEHAKAYKKQFGDLNITSRYISPDGYTLGRWIGNARQKYTNAKKNEKDPLSNPELRQLDNLGMIWEKSSDAYQLKLKIAREYLSENGDLEAMRHYVTEDGFRLGQWLSNQRTRKKRNAAWQKTEDELAQLEALGMRWRSKAECTWEKNFQIAKQYYETNHHLNMPCNYTVNQFNLGKWICRQREHYRDKKLTSEQITRLESIAMEWISPFRWNQYYSAAEAYYQEHGNLNIQLDYKTADGVLLGRWLFEQRMDRERGTISEEHLQKLNVIHMNWAIKADGHWDKMLLDLTEWISSHRNVSFMPRDTKAEDGTNLYLWAKHQLQKSHKGQLIPRQQRQWNMFMREMYYYIQQ